MTNQEPLGPTVGNAFVVGAEEYGLQKMKLLTLGERMAPLLKISVYLSVR